MKSPQAGRQPNAQEACLRLTPCLLLAFPSVRPGVADGDLLPMGDVGLGTWGWGRGAGDGERRHHSLLWPEGPRHRFAPHEFILRSG